MRIRPFALAPRGGLVCGALALASWAPVAWAAVQVSPIRLTFTPRDRVLVVTLTNPGTQEVTVQSEAFRWSQGADGADQLDPTNDIVASPPLLKLAPGARGLIRLARLRHEVPAQELSYRLFVQELPGAEDGNPQAGLAMRFTFTYSLPVFVPPPKPVRTLECQPSPAPLSVQCRNHGNAFARIRGVKLVRGETELASVASGPYLLAGASQVIALKPPAAPAAGPARAVIELEDGSTQSLDLVLP